VNFIQENWRETQVTLLIYYSDVS